MSSSEFQIITSDCIVIGAGITGLTLATILQRQGINVTVLNKEPNVGGRMATCRIAQNESIEGVFDYGTQYFTAKSPQFKAWVNEWLKNQVVKEWSKGFDGVDSIPHYCGINGMNGIADYLVRELDVRNSTEVTEISYEKKWLVETKKQQYQGDMLVITSPIPQSLLLLDASFLPLPLEVRFSLEQIEYDSCITVLALLEKPSNIPTPGGMKLQDDSLAWLGDNHQKGISPNAYAVTINATAKFSDYYWDSDDAEIAYKLLTAAADYLASPVIKYQVHRWRYRFPKTFYSESSYLALFELPMVMAGDAFTEPTVEGAALSAIAAGELISQRFNVNN